MEKQHSFYCHKFQ